MREKSFVPTNLFTSFKLADALPEVKLVAASIWISPHISCVGVGEIPLAPLAATVGLAKEQTATALRLLEDAEAIAMDRETGEIFILDWFRFNTFKKGVSTEIANKQIEKIRSEHLKALIREKSRGCFPTATATATSLKEAEDKNKAKAAAAPQHKKRRVSEAGIVCWGAEDEKKAAQLESSISCDVLAKAIYNLSSTCKEPLPGRVENEVEKITRKLKTEGCAKDAAALQLKSFVLNVESQAKGAAIVKRVRDNLSQNSPPLPP